MPDQEKKENAERKELAADNLEATELEDEKLEQASGGGNTCNGICLPDY